MPYRGRLPLAASNRVLVLRRMTISVLPVYSVISHVVVVPYCKSSQTSSFPFFSCLFLLAVTPHYEFPIAPLLRLLIISWSLVILFD